MDARACGEGKIGLRNVGLLDKTICPSRECMYKLYTVLRVNLTQTDLIVFNAAYSGILSGSGRCLPPIAMMVASARMSVKLYQSMFRS